MNAIRGSVTKLLASDTRVGGPHSTPADVVAVPSTPGVATRAGGGGDAPESLIAARMELEDLRRERAAVRDAMAAEIAAAEARVRGENERARIATEKADAEASRVAAALAELRERTTRAEERDDALRRAERRLNELKELEAEIEARRTAATAAEADAR